MAAFHQDNGTYLLRCARCLRVQKQRVLGAYRDMARRR
jgi:hypothetical protein